jgi:hypothetical protein
VKKGAVAAPNFGSHLLIARFAQKANGAQLPLLCVFGSEIFVLFRLVVMGYGNPLNANALAALAGLAGAALGKRTRGVTRSGRSYGPSYGIPTYGKPGSGRSKWKKRKRAQKPLGGPMIRPPRLPDRPERPPYVAKKVSRKFYRTRGSYVGPFRKGKYMKVGSVSKQGAMLQVEKGGTVTADKCVYIGHSTVGIEKLLKVVTMAIVRRLGHQLGQQIVTFKEQIGSWAVAHTNNIGILYYNYNTASQNASATASVTIGPTMQYETLVTNLITSIKSAAASAASDTFEIVEIWIQLNEDNVTPDVTPITPARLHLRGAYVKFTCYSNLKIQNRTLANSGANPEHHDSMLDVENNPLQGKSYLCKGNQFKMRWNNDASNTFGLRSDNDSGVIDGGDIDAAGLSGEMVDLLQRPPSNNMFVGTRKIANVRLGPGEIKSCSIRYKRQISLARLFRAFTPHLVGQTQTFWESRSKLFAFEKMMHTDDATEPDMNIGYECNSFYSAVLRTTKPRVLVQKDVL